MYNKIIKGSSNGNQFKDFLINVIDECSSSKYLLMDNARIHHSKIVLDYVNTTNCSIIYNVPYCPEYNPIGSVFSKFKSIIRKKDNSLSSKLIKNINNAFKKISKNDLLNFYKNSFTFV